MSCASRAGFFPKIIVGKYADNSLSKSKVRNNKDYSEKCHEWKFDRQINVEVGVELKKRNN